MIAVQFHDVRIKLKLRDLSQVSIFDRYSYSGEFGLKSDIDQGEGATPLVCSGGGINTRLLCRYVFVDDAERREFALSDHHYLITETQYQQFANEPSQSVQTFQVHMNHPMKEFLAYFVKAEYRDPTKSKCVDNFWNFTMDGGNPGEVVVGCPQRPEAFTTMNLLLNQQRVYADGQPAMYFGNLLPSQFHTRVPEGKERVYTMPFALDPETWKPTGSINFSRIETAQIELRFPMLGPGEQLPAGTWTLIGRNFNQVKVKSGMLGKRWAS